MIKIIVVVILFVIKMLTTAFTKFVSKFAGPIGAAIMVADFGFCLYGAAND
ncbi:MAG: hypothetical protein ABF260_02255 [Flavobacteriaceae bacterium]